VIQFSCTASWHWLHEMCNIVVTAVEEDGFGDWAWTTGPFDQSYDTIYKPNWCTNGTYQFSTTSITMIAADILGPCVGSFPPGTRLFLSIL
jgi:hypothetical protein